MKKLVLAIATGGLIGFVAGCGGGASYSCCLNGKAYNCNSSEAATKCFNSSDTSGCSADPSKDAPSGSTTCKT